MPATWRAHVIGEHLDAAGVAAEVHVCDLYALRGQERHAVLDVMVRDGAEPPMVLVAGVVVCTDGIDVDAVLRAVQD